MFTGIIETVGEISSTRRVEGDLHIVVAAPVFSEREIAIGDSIACNGVCLTVVERQQECLSFDVSIESLDHSLIGEWRLGTRINLEMALLPTTRMGGHLVSGHVDGIARLVQSVTDARSQRLVFEVPKNLQKYIARKGSITVNGVSLTVNSAAENTFDINVIPHTLKATTLGDLRVSEQVHIEVDLIARYLERLLSGEDSAESKLSKKFLAEHGFS